MDVSDNVALRLDDQKVRRPDARDARRGGAAHGAPRRLREAAAGPAVRRPAPARRAGARARESAVRAAAGRAAGRARPEAAPGDAGGAQDDPARGRHHVHLRDARPGRGAQHERPDRDLPPRPDRADRDAGGRLRTSGDGVRGRLRWHLQHPRRRRCRRQCSGEPGPFTIRPEKIRITDAVAAGSPAPGSWWPRAASATWFTSARRRAITCRSTPAASSPCWPRTSTTSSMDVLAFKDSAVVSGGTSDTRCRWTPTPTRRARRQRRER